MNDPKNPIHEHDPTTEKLAIQFDAREFAHFLDDIDMSEAQKLEYIETIWTIILHFIDMGFGIHPLQQACGQFDEPAALCAVAESRMVESPHSDFCKAASADESPRFKLIPDTHEGENHEQ